MSSFTAKPYSAPGKSSGLQRFNPERKTDGNKCQTLPASMPSLSGDILKQQIAAMHKSSSLVQPKKGKTPSPVTPTKAPIISEEELITRRNSMHRTPAPPTPDAKPSNSETPEFLRRKLRPTKVGQTESGENGRIVEETDDKEDCKRTFRNSKIIFEKMATAPKVIPKPAPKPKTGPKPASFKTSNEKPNNEGSASKIEESQEIQPEFEKQGLNSLDDSNTEKKNEAEISKDNTEVLDQLEKVLDAEEEAIKIDEELNSKPVDLEMPVAPIGLDLWMNQFVKGNTKLCILEITSPTGFNKPINPNSSLGGVKTESISKTAIPADEEELYDDVAVPTPVDVNEEVYDDVNDGYVISCKTDDIESSQNDQDELYDDVAGSSNQEKGDELYDDVAGSSNQEKGDELYDDVAATAKPDDSEEFYDDVVGAVHQGNGQDINDVDDRDTPEAMGNQIPVDEIDAGEADAGMALYEPVETIAQYVSRDSLKSKSSVPDEQPSKQTPEKVNKKKEEKERKEREKIEKRRREEAERQKKKDEEEKRKREKEERKRIEKERKLFNLKPDEDPVPTERRMVEVDVKGKNKDLTITRGEYVDVISKHNCPKGKVLVQNSSGKLGYVSLKDIGMDKRQSLLICASPVAAGVAFGEMNDDYDDVSDLQANSSSYEIVSLSSNLSTETSTIPSFGQSGGVFKTGKAAKKPQSSTGSNDGDEGGELYEQI